MVSQDSLDGRLRGRVLERLGVAAPSHDLDGLSALYRAWCARVPFDNVRKMIALRASDRRELPGMDAREFFACWLEHGAGGTCWPTSNALVELLRSCGFSARRALGAMRDLGIVNHASAVVSLDDGAWLVDSSLLTDVPLPLRDGVFVRHDPVLPVEVERDGASHVIWSHTPPSEAFYPCRVLPDPASRALYAESYERSRERSPFNQRLYARRNRSGELLILFGTTRFSRTARGLAARELAPDALATALREDIGLAGALVDEWVSSGALAASQEPPAGPRPPAPTRLRPSERGSEA